MTSTFFGIEVAVRALQTQQKALDVTGHNIANAGTMGFSRQEALLETTSPFPAPGLNALGSAGQVGTGVTVAEIRRLRDSFIDSQIRQESKSLGYWETRLQALEKTEVVLNEPSTSGLSEVLQEFWESLEELSQGENASSLSVRSVVCERGAALAETFNHIDRQLKELQEDIDDSIYVRVHEVNSLGSQIAQLNSQILRIETAGAQANDLRDKRDLLLDRLSEVVDINAYQDGQGMVQVIAGGRPLVQGVYNYDLVAREDPSSNEGYYGVYRQSDGEPVQIEEGVLKGLLEMRGLTGDNGESGYLAELRAQLDELAVTLADEFNAIHKEGYGLDESSYNIPFFTFNNEDQKGAGTIEVNRAVLDDPNKVAAAAGIVLATEVEAAEYANYIEVVEEGVTQYIAWETGDGSKALELAELLKEDLVMILPGSTEPTGTFEDYYQAIIGELGVAGQQAERMVENQETLVAALENSREAVSGVSLDEEMVNMIRFQQAYNAAARMVTTIDELLDRIINHTGRVGL